MCRERVAGWIGLGLFFLFPLVSLLQLRDGDEAWRQVAGQARPSVLSLYAGRGGDVGMMRSVPAGCALVLDDSPLRVAVAGSTPDQPLASPTGTGWIDWHRIYADPAGDFAILQADSPGDRAPSMVAAVASARPSLSSLVPVDPASLGDVEAPEEGAEAIGAVLVAPAQLPRMPIWVGELLVERAADGRPSYRGSSLRPLRAAEGIATAEAEPQPGVDPVLQGAPFVSRAGVVLALYAGERAGASRGVPMALVREAMTALKHGAER